MSYPGRVFVLEVYVPVGWECRGIAYRYKRFPSQLTCRSLINSENSPQFNVGTYYRLLVLFKTCVEF